MSSSFTYSNLHVSHCDCLVWHWTCGLVTKTLHELMILPSWSRSDLYMRREGAAASRRPRPVQVDGQFGSGVEGAVGRLQSNESSRGATSSD